MGLTTPVAELIAHEAAFRPLRGDFAVLGKQTTYLTERTLNWLLEKYGLSRPIDLKIDIDTTTAAVAKGGGTYPGPAGQPLRLISDTTFCRALGADRFFAVDVSDYEGADIVCDMSLPIPKELHSRFDVIYDGSSLDNIFNPAEALMNMSRMLRPGGRLIIAEHGSMFCGPYTCFSPGWFFDFFTANNYRDCKVYLGAMNGVPSMVFGPMPIFFYNWFGDPNGMTPPVSGNDVHLFLIVIAEKGDDSTDDVSPVQYQYRDAKLNETDFAPKARRIASSPRPLHSAETGGRPFEQLPNFIQCGTLCVDAPF
jgi:SAM-dependent methyltransferase